MSKLSLVLLMLTIAAVIVAMLLEAPFVSGGSGVIYVVALVYFYTIAKREAELLVYAVNNREAETGN